MCKDKGLCHSNRQDIQWMYTKIHGVFLLKKTMFTINISIGCIIYIIYIHTSSIHHLHSIGKCDSWLSLIFTRTKIILICPLKKKMAFSLKKSHLKKSFAPDLEIYKKTCSSVRTFSLAIVEYITRQIEMIFTNFIFRDNSNVNLVF